MASVGLVEILILLACICIPFILALAGVGFYVFLRDREEG